MISMILYRNASHFGLWWTTIDIAYVAGSEEMKKLTILSLVCTAALGRADILYYNGDFDGNSGRLACVGGSVDGQMYEDFTLAAGGEITGLFGNFQSDTPNWSQAAWEIRSGVSVGNGGTLIASGTSSVSSIIATGRSNVSPEYQVTVSGLNVVLGPGTYFMSLSVVGIGFISSASGTDEGPVGDPNPGVTGSPINNGVSFWSSSFFGANFEANPWENSYGVIGTVPEPGTFVAIGFGLCGLAMARRRRK